MAYCLKLIEDRTAPFGFFALMKVFADKTASFVLFGNY